MNRTKIEWTDYTWNPVTGCLNNCSYCYARKVANRFRSKYTANSVLPKHDESNHELHHADPFYPRFWPSRIDDPASLRSEFNKIFVCSMGELFGDWIPEDWQREVINVAETCTDQTFQFLTKQPQNLAKWNPWPDNAWVGATVTADGPMTTALTNLACVNAKVRFLSIEPLLGAITMKSHPIKGIVDWIIIGAQTNPYRPPRTECVNEIIDAADKAGIPVFLKDNLSGPERRREWPNFT